MGIFSRRKTEKAESMTAQTLLDFLGVSTTDGTDGIGGKVWAQDIAINSGATATVVIGTNGADTTLTPAAE